MSSFYVLAYCSEVEGPCWTAVHTVWRPLACVCLPLLSAAPPENLWVDSSDESCSSVDGVFALCRWGRAINLLLSPLPDIQIHRVHLELLKISVFIRFFFPWFLSDWLVYLFVSSRDKLKLITVHFSVKTNGMMIKFYNNCQSSIIYSSSTIYLIEVLRNSWVTFIFGSTNLHLWLCLRALQQFIIIFLERVYVPNIIFQAFSTVMCRKNLQNSCLTCGVCFSMSFYMNDKVYS